MVPFLLHRMLPAKGETPPRPYDRRTDLTGPPPQVSITDGHRLIGEDGAMGDDWLTIGIEEEFQIIDGEGQLRAHIDTLLSSARPALGDAIKPEMLQSVVEVG